MLPAQTTFFKRFVILHKRQNGFGRHFAFPNPLTSCGLLAHGRYSTAASSDARPVECPLQWRPVHQARRRLLRRGQVVAVGTVTVTSPQLRDIAEFQAAHRASSNACRPFGKSVAEIALQSMALRETCLHAIPLSLILLACNDGHRIVGTGGRALPAPDAPVVPHRHNARLRVLEQGIPRAYGYACRMRAMIA